VYNYNTKQKSAILHLNITSITIKSVEENESKPMFRGTNGLYLEFDTPTTCIFSDIDAYPFTLYANVLHNYGDDIRIQNSTLRQVLVDFWFINSFIVKESTLDNVASVSKMFIREILMENSNISNFLLHADLQLCDLFSMYNVIATKVDFRQQCDTVSVRKSTFIESSLAITQSYTVMIEHSSFSDYIGAPDFPVLSLAQVNLPGTYYDLSILNSTFTSNGVNFDLPPSYTSYYSTILLGSSFFEQGTNSSISISGCTFINNTAVKKNSTIFAPPLGTTPMYRILEWPLNSTLDFVVEPKNPTCFPGSDTLSRNDTCVLCDFGQYSPKGGLCQPCAIGHIAKLQGQDKCEPCRPGLFQNETGQSKCNPCGKWSIAPGIGSINCTLCEPGYHSNDNLKCKPCEAGKYQTPHDSDSLLGCSSCKWFEGSKEGSIKCSFGSIIIYGVIGAGGALVLLIIIAIVICVCCCKKKRNDGYEPVNYS